MSEYREPWEVLRDDIDQINGGVRSVSVESGVKAATIHKWQEPAGRTFQLDNFVRTTVALCRMGRCGFLRYLNRRCGFAAVRVPVALTGVWSRSTAGMVRRTLKETHEATDALLATVEAGSLSHEEQMNAVREINEGVEALLHAREFITRHPVQ